MTDTKSNKASKRTSKIDQHANQTHNDSSPSSEDKSLSMVRDLLFGEQKREHDQRIVDLEKLIDKHDQSIRQDMSTDFEDVNTELRLLNKLLSEENKARLDDSARHQERLKQVSKEHHAFTKEMQKTFAIMKDEMADMKKQFEKEQQKLLKAFERKNEQLQKSKADRKLLATTFAKLAAQLESAK